MFSSTKIEHRALNCLEAIIDEHQTMEYQFNGNDKEMSWDGYIWLCKDDTDIQPTMNFDVRVPVQIKGHLDYKRRYIDCKTISYPVRLVDLEAYATEKGVLYFQIFIDEHISSIFYASLFPSKIADYIDSARKKGNKSTYNIPFRKLEMEPNKLYIVAKQFDNESRKQGSAYTPLVQDRIKCDEFSKLKSISITVVGASDSYSVLRRLASGDICLYGKTDDDKYERPMEWLDNFKFFTGKDVNREIAVGNEVFYQKYRCVADSDGGMTIIPSPNLELRITEGKLNFKLSSTLAEIYKDARFILKVNEINSFSIAGNVFPFNSAGLSADFEGGLKYIVDFCETLQMIGLATNVEIDYYSPDQQQQIVKLISIRRGRFNSQLQEGYNKYLWNFDKKYVPIIIYKSNDTIELIDAIYTDKIVIFLPSSVSDDERGFRVPLFVYQDVEVLSNLYRYDYDALQKQIDYSDINEMTSDAMLDCFLLIVNVYDRNRDEHFLDIAEHLLNLLAPYISETITLLNRLQINKRRRTLTDEEVELINNIKDTDEPILFGKSVLLGDKEKAIFYFDQFPVDEQERYNRFPIYTLFLKL